MSDNIWYPESGPLVDLHSADVKQILTAADRYYVASYKHGMTMTLMPAGPSHFRRGWWFISFNPADLYHPHQWFHEASGEDGIVFNQKTLGPRAVDIFADHLKGLWPL